MVIGGEVDCGKWNVAEEASGGTLVKANETKVLDDPHGRATGDAGDRFGNFTLDLQADLNNFEGVGEDLHQLLVAKRTE